MSNSTYNENSIKILSRESVLESFPWALIDKVSKSYHVPLKCVQRSFEACFTAGIQPSYYVDKYLKGKPLDINQEFQEAYAELVKKALSDANCIK